MTNIITEHSDIFVNACSFLFLDDDDDDLFDDDDRILELLSFS